MNLSFKECFVEKIKSGSKIHTIRADPSHRWTAGNKIHFITNPRTPQQYQFCSGVCYSTQLVLIHPKTREIFIQNEAATGWSRTPPSFNHSFSQNDGFDCSADLFDFFSGCDQFEGKIIHWTALRYQFDEPFNHINRDDGRL